MREPALAAYFEPAARDFDDAAFAAMLGHPLPAAVPERPFHLNSTLGEVGSTWLGRKLQQLMRSQAMQAAGDDPGESSQRMMDAVIAEMPLRNLVTMSQGKLSPALMRAMIHMMNGHWGKLLRNAPVGFR